WFVYVIDDGHGRLSYATVTVTVAAGGTVSGRVWGDADGDGIQDAAEANSNLSGVQVQLLDANNTVIATATTGSNGTYSFADVAPGQYKVRVVLPTGYAFSPEHQGSNSSLDSDVNASGHTDLFTVASSNALDFDAGLVPSGGSGGEG